MHALLDFTDDITSAKFDRWKLHLTRKNGHVYVTWAAAINCTRTELRRMHQHFNHPSTERLHAVIRRADPMGCLPRLLNDLEDTTLKCEVCQRAAGPPERFRSSLLKDDTVFNKKICLDLIKLGSRSALHEVDKAIKFAVARFLRSESAACVYGRRLIRCGRKPISETLTHWRVTAALPSPALSGRSS